MVNVITNSEVPPALIVGGVKDFETVGRLAVTPSVSLAVHTPRVEQALVLVTLGGTVIEAVLVISVCAETDVTKNKTQKAIKATDVALTARVKTTPNKDNRLCTFNFTNDLPRIQCNKLQSE